MENKLTTSENHSVRVDLPACPDGKLCDTAAQAIGQLLDEIKFLNNILTLQHGVIDRLEKVNALQEQLLNAKPNLLDFMRGA